MYEDLLPEERILLAIDHVLHKLPIPAALAALMDAHDLEAIRNP